jgi:hypothetical protein
MKKCVSAILAGMVLCVSALAQETPRGDVANAQQGKPATMPTNPAQGNTVPRFAPGTVIPVELTKSIDAKKVKTGDGVEAKVTQDLKAENGQVIVPKDTKVVGHVTEAQARNKEQKESQVGIVFDHAVMKGGSDVAMPMSIQAIIAPTALGAGSSNGSPDKASRAGDMSPASPTPPSSAGGRSAGMGTSSPSTVSPSAAGGEAPATTQPGAATHEPVTASTQGVVGISNLTLSATPDTKVGSVVSSEKSNVKLESGTFMLLRVNQ